jgi:hypothetical protein
MLGEENDIGSTGEEGDNEENLQPKLSESI